MYKSREETIKEVLPEIKAFRFDQINRALFDLDIHSFSQITTLSKIERETIGDKISWMSISLFKVFTSKNLDTHKAILKSQDGQFFESVLMKNRKGQWTICVSSQIGCAMRCVFCATGAMGLTRSLHANEIVDQYRFWKQYLNDSDEESKRISNVVFMGMGEPFANIDNVKKAIHTWLDCTDLGPTKIMVSTVGIIVQLEKILDDPDWPPVQIALSLHSPDQKKRLEIVPTTTPEFLNKLADWSRRYAKKLGNRNHKLTFEYTLISGENDGPEFAKELASYIKKTAFDKINVIPYNPVKSKDFETSDRERIDAFKKILRDRDVNVTERKTMGDDIDAACGQLATADGK